MSINMIAFNKLLNDKFNNNQAEMARTLMISRYQLNMVLKHQGKNAGKKVIGAIIQYCEKNNLDFHNYIFLPS